MMIVCIRSPSALYIYFLCFIIIQKLLCDFAAFTLFNRIIFQNINQIIYIYKFVMNKYLNWNKENQTVFISKLIK